MSQLPKDSQLMNWALEQPIEEEAKDEERYVTGFSGDKKPQLAASPPSSDVRGKFIGNIRDIKSEKELKEELDTFDDKAALLAADSENSSQISGTRAIQQKLEDDNAIFSRIRLLEHLFMIAWLALIILLWLKKNVPDVASYNYLVAFGVPGSAMAITGCDVLYERHIRAFQDSNSGIHLKLSSSLVTLNLSLISLIIMFSLYLNSTNDLEWLGIVCLVPLYIGWCVITGFFIFILPGLMESFPFY